MAETDEATQREPLAVAAASECNEGLSCRASGCEDAMRSIGHVPLPSELAYEPSHKVLWCRPPADVLGSTSKTLAYATPSLALVLIAAAFARGSIVRATTWGRRAPAVALGALAFFAALVAPPNRSLLRLIELERALVAAITLATVVGIGLAARAHARSIRAPARVLAASLLPLVVGATVAEHVRANAVRLTGWSWSGEGFDVRGRILAELVEEVGVPFAFGLGGTAAVLVAIALVDAPASRPPVVWKRTALGLALALGARAVAWRTPIGVGLVLGALVIVALAFLARGATRHILVLAVIAVDLVTLAGAVRNDVAMVGWEEGWPNRFVWIELAMRLLYYAPALIAADVVLALLVGDRRTIDEAPTAIDRARLFGLAFAGGALLVGPSRVGALILHQAAIVERLTAVAGAIGVPNVTSVERAALAPAVVALRSGALEHADIDDAARWTPATPRPAVLRVDPILAILPRGITIADAGERLGSQSARGTAVLTLVETAQPNAGFLARAFVGPPLRSVPLVFDLPREDFDHKLYDGSNVAARVHGDRVEIFQVGFAKKDVELARAGAAVEERCSSPFMGPRRNGLLILVGDRSRTLEEAFRLGETLDPGLDLYGHASGTKCRFRAIAFIASVP